MRNRGVGGVGSHGGVRTPSAGGMGPNLLMTLFFAGVGRPKIELFIFRLSKNVLSGYMFLAAT